MQNPKLNKKTRQWLWFIGLYLSGLLVVTALAYGIRWAMGIS